MLDNAGAADNRAYTAVTLEEAVFKFATRFPRFYDDTKIFVRFPLLH